MLDVYLYGASDDCCEIETSDENLRHENYGDIDILWVHNMGDCGTVTAHYVYEDDWGVQIQGDIPEDWRIKCIDANTARSLRRKENAGQFIHMQVPDHYQLEFFSLDEPPRILPDYSI